jgi:tol-pal system protein YbgF
MGSLCSRKVFVQPWRHRSWARWLLPVLVLTVPALLSGCLTRTPAGPQLPYVQPANVVPQTDPAPLQTASRMQEIEQELQRLRDQLERLQAGGGNDATIRNLQERVSTIERQLGLEAHPEAAQQTTSAPPPVPPVQQGQYQPPAPAQHLAVAPPAEHQPGAVEIRDVPLSFDERAYREAYAAFRGGSLDRAVQMLEEFLKNYPKSEYASSAIYWLGEARFAQGRFDEAVLQFDRVLKEYPGSKKELNSLLKQGESFEKMGETPSARVIFEKIVNEYPHTAQGRLAGGKLKSLPKE